MPPTLAALPTELLEMIAGDSDSWKEDPMLALRATSRELWLKLDHLFTATYFTTRYVWLSLEKLNELRDISTVSRLAARMKTAEVICRPDQSGIMTQTDDSHMQALFDTASKALAATLGSLLRRFPQLTTIEFTNKTREDTSTLLPSFQIIDVSSTFANVMDAINAHGIKPNTLRTMTTGDPALLTTSIHGLLGLPSCLSMLETLELDMLLADSRSGKTMNGTELGLELTSVLQQSPNLVSLSLGMSFTEEAGNFFRSFANSARIQHLREFNIRRALCTSADLTLLMLAHTHTLQECSLGSLRITGASGDHRTVIYDVLGVLREKLRLKRVVLSRLNTEHDTVVFSGMGQTMWWETSGEEEWITVFHSDEYIELDGYDEVQDGLAQARKCVTYVPRR
ncbi:hypothetical protein LTR56_010307 [Elasticomyces elasticus]|nr:hypothetical protein LTR56_010307 [Elasticomyces elasticus]KAK3658255.1 hypothetical protein LTR22_008956 [Elasticomyces elasticus]KAK4922984.1 hypothetical protein LTR49_009815 [Elasticomyces elasticus]KAK5747695.1 hypothetical protein LTS12_022244 [Elasticomyces elasticus]